ncbi:MAG: hypothetical protein D6806_04725 [Deltaproteobacteria bacterium]|nr:MAG: hypothetical protein D6806_04725 [Deltaproteobacteria bacterium]
MRLAKVSLVAASLAFVLSGCGSSGGDKLEIAGTYTDDWQTTHTVTETTWTMHAEGMSDSVFHIVAYDNDADYLVAQNDSNNEYNPDKWSRFDWTEKDGALYYCQAAFDADTQEAATANTSADRNDLESGCGGFSWSKLTPAQ